MTPKEKAEELYYKFTSFAPLHNDNKQCALISVNEIIIQLIEGSSLWIYWIDVKHEIEKL